MSLLSNLLLFVCRKNIYFFHTFSISKDMVKFFRMC